VSLAGQEGAAWADEDAEGMCWQCAADHIMALLCKSLHALCSASFRSLSHTPYQCINVLEICARPEPIADTEEFVQLAQQQIISDHIETVIHSVESACLLPNPVGVTVLPDPVVVKRLEWSAGRGSVQTFCGLYGCQMMSFVVQVLVALMLVLLVVLMIAVGTVGCYGAVGIVAA